MALKHVPYWLSKSFAEMTKEEWESLCDHCGKCCLHKLEDDETGDVYYTRVVCRGYDLDKGKCAVYDERRRRVAECLVIDRNNVTGYSWLPKTCAYRLLAEGASLKSWHPLISGSADSVAKAGIAVACNAIHESKINLSNLENYIVDWVE